MSLTSNIVRAINTPTVMEEYEQDQEGYNQMVDPETATELSREHDRVTGNESLYRTLLSRINTEVPFVITGNEGFFDSVKSITSTIVQTVKDFFKWLWTFFTGKTVIWDGTASDHEKTIKKFGVKQGDIEYPSSFVLIYNQTTTPPSNLLWMNTAIPDCVEGINKVTAYVNALKKFSNSVGDLLSNDKAGALDKEIADLHAEIKSIFKINGNDPVKFFCNYSVTVSDPGVVTVNPPTALSGGKKDIKFKTDLNQVNSFITAFKKFNAAFVKHLESSVSLETGFLKALNKSLEAAKAGDPNKSAPGKIQTVIRDSMASIKRLESAIQRASSGALNVIGATVANSKGK